MKINKTLSFVTSGLIVMATPYLAGGVSCLKCACAMVKGVAYRATQYPIQEVTEYNRAKLYFEYLEGGDEGPATVQVATPLYYNSASADEVVCPGGASVDVTGENIYKYEFSIYIISCRIAPYNVADNILYTGTASGGRTKFKKTKCAGA